ncbi:MAG: putative metal-dependent hydrolase [Haliscomenobacter sp.]|nr:putative metal-dependent hydrolase [Haliscomenobacter sp.]
MSPNLEVLRYPVGKFIMPTEFSPEQLDHWIADIDHFASAVRHGVEGLSDHQIDIPYREGGWSIRQLVHHLADSHMNAFMRTRWVLTEDMPTIKPYDQDAWSNLVDNKTAPMEWSLLILEGVHKRWASLLRRVEDWSLFYIHPEYHHRYRLDQMLALYHWHGNHHLGQITGLREHMGW